MGESAIGSVGVCVLAAGASLRMGGPKLLLPFGETTLLERAVATAIESGVGEVAVVVGAYAEEMAPVLAPYDATVIVNRAWGTGQSSSVRAAAAWARKRHLQSLILVVADQPFVEARHLRALADAAALDARLHDSEAPSCHTRGSRDETSRALTSRALYLTAHGERSGNPALFPDELFDDLQQLEGDEGARALVRRARQSGAPPVRFVESGSVLVFDDVDTEEDYVVALHKVNARNGQGEGGAHE